MGSGDLGAFALVAFVAFLGFGVACWRFRISYRVSVVAGLVLLVIAGLLVVVGQADVGNFLGILAYYFLAIGVALAILEWRREPRQTSVTSSQSDSEDVGHDTPPTNAVRLRKTPSRPPRRPGA